MHKLFLSFRVGLTLAIMWVVNPPEDSEEDCPGGGKNVVCEEKMGKVECPPGVLL